MNIIKNESGTVAIIISLLTMFVLTALGTVAYMNATTEVKIGANFHNFQRAFYAADGGSQEALGWLKTNHDITRHFLNDSTLDQNTTPTAPAVVDPNDPNSHGYTNACMPLLPSYQYTYRMVSLDPDLNAPAGYIQKKRTQQSKGFSGKQTTAYAGSSRIWKYYYQIDSSGSGIQNSASAIKVTASYLAEN